MKTNWLSNGLALFSMFFGAGNIIFPIIVGQHVQGKFWYAFIGLLLTAVLPPFVGLISMTFFQGDYVRFFKRIGRYPGAFVIILILAIITPFGGIPRCITLTYSTLSVYLPGLNLIWFSIGSALFIFFCCVRENKVLDLLGYVLTPLLLIFLAIIAIKGVVDAPEIVPSAMSGTDSFFFGLVEGYNTMDLPAVFFFSAFVCHLFKQEHKGEASPRQMMSHLLKASMIAAGLLTLVYMGFGYVAAVFGDQLTAVRSDQFLGAIGGITLGQWGGIVISLAVALSTLTTAIALTVVGSDFLRVDVCKNKIPHWLSLVVILGITVWVSMYEFSGIVAFLSPLLQLMYPSLLFLCVLNLLYKLFDFKPVKWPFYIVFAITVVLRFIKF
ncbi:MAG: branched-chain amino acid transport system II carrier protein [Simkaniaceae bacterium]|nr:branched-chain amino acid transport system II carrier protein [Simkaniaceae bacterium]